MSELVRSSPFELVVFDFKGTLQVKQKNKTGDKATRKLAKLQRRAQHFYDKLVAGGVPNLPSYDKFFDSFKRIKEEYDRTKSECYSWSTILEALRIEFELPDISQYYNEFLDSVPAPLYDGATEILQKIYDNNIPMVMVRNSNLSRVSMESTLDFLGIGKYFKYIVTSGEVGKRKPDKEIFEFCIQKGLSDDVNLSPDKILMVGNETEADISGAKQLGWKTVLLCNTEESSNGIADFDLQSLNELDSIIFPNK